MTRTHDERRAQGVRTRTHDERRQLTCADDESLGEEETVARTSVGRHATCATRKLRSVTHAGRNVTTLYDVIAPRQPDSKATYNTVNSATSHTTLCT